jgi:hypothetical protein
MVMVPEEAQAVLEEVPNDEDIDPEDDDNGEGGMTAKVVDFDRDKEGRLSNRQPTGPGNAENEADALDQ